MLSRFFFFHAQHVDEHVFEAGLGFFPGQVAAAARPERGFERGAIRPGDTQRVSEYGGCLDSWRAANASGRDVQIAARRLEDDEA